jgi:hypothetical protein
MQTDLSFFRLTLLGMGLQKPKSNKKKQNQNEYQMAKPCLAF